MPLIILILFLGIIAYFVCYLKTARKGQALFPKRVLQKLEGETSQLTLRQAYKKWSNPEIRDSILPRLDALRRIWDLKTLERLAAGPDYTVQCEAQRLEALCRTGHNWKYEGTRLVMQNEDDWGSIRWNVPQYRCTRCGKTKEGKWVQC